MAMPSGLAAEGRHDRSVARSPRRCLVRLPGDTAPFRNKAFLSALGRTFTWRSPRGNNFERAIAA
jgi:hypothetical protein